MEVSIILCEEQNIEIGRRIEARRKVLNISSRELGTALGVSHQQIYKYECGKDRVSIVKLKKIAEILHTGIDHFIDSDEASNALLQDSPNRAKILDEEIIKLAKYYTYISDNKIRTSIRDLVKLIAKNYKD